jgi:hypothetical protein
MRATLTFDLPEERGEFDAALLGRKALSVLWEIDQRLRSLVKHGEPSLEARQLAEEIREMIPGELLDV